MATSAAQLFVMENRFYGRAAIALCVLIVVGFALFNILGITDITVMPRSAHLHGVLMSSWVILFLVQNALGAGRNLSLHRKLGWLGAALAAASILAAWNTGFVTTALDRAPPIFYPPYFLALNLITPVLFGGMIIAAIANRKRTDWHRRLMLGALILVIEPALGRLGIIGTAVAMGGPENAIPFLVPRPWFVPMLEMTVQVAIVLAIMARDRSMRGSVHPALKWVLAAVVGLYAGNWLLAAVPPFAEYAFALKGSAL